ncbi:MAG: hypothetical protein FWD16_03505 [Clostridia bacterium]|nr:hypothetical protein [Clostridia bacterium]
MKHLKTLLTALTIAALLCAAGCALPTATNAPPTQTAASQTDIGPTQPTDQTTPASTAQASEDLIRIDFATEENLEGYEGFDEFVEAESGDRRAFFAQGYVRDFALIEIDYTEADGDFQFFESKVLYEQPMLLPVRPFVAETFWSETIPTHGIRFVDENGATRYFWLSESGENGKLFMVEFENHK